MDAQEAIITFSQSEKIKSGLIWTCQSLEMMNRLPKKDQHGAKEIIKTMLNMIYDEVSLARRQTENTSSWEQAGKHIRMAIVMINSQVAHEAVFHLVQALSQVTNIGHRSWKVLSVKF